MVIKILGGEGLVPKIPEVEVIQGIDLTEGWNGQERGLTYPA